MALLLFLISSLSKEEHMYCYCAVVYRQLVVSVFRKIHFIELHNKTGHALMCLFYSHFHRPCFAFRAAPGGIFRPCSRRDGVL